MPPLMTATVAELIEHLGVPPERIRMRPLPGQAKEADVLRVEPRCELIDAVLVERAMGFYEARVGAVLIHYVETYLDTHDLGIVLGADGLMRLEAGQVRIPDVAFYGWDHFPNRLLPDEQILSEVPDWAVEILSPGNTDKEMERKRREYFAGGAQLMWIVDPVQRTVEVFTTAETSRRVDETQTLDGGSVLPGFTLGVSDWFARAGRRA
jgi:Uma2 family endonuclease